MPQSNKINIITKNWSWKRYYQFLIINILNINNDMFWKGNALSFTSEQRSIYLWAIRKSSSGIQTIEVQKKTSKYGETIDERKREKRNR